MKNSKEKVRKAILAYTTKVEKEQSDVEKAGLKGQVKQLMHTCYKAHKIHCTIIQGKIEIDSIYSKTNFIKTYNDKGAKTQEQIFGKGEYNLNFYNDKGLQTESINYLLDGSLRQKTTMIYNSKGNLLEYVVRKADGSISSKTMDKYNDDGKILESISYNGDENISSKTIYTYNEQGNMLSYIKYKGDGSIEHQSYMKYDERGFKIEDISEWTEKRMQPYNRRYEYVNNEHGDCIEMLYYKADGKLENTSTFTYQYDKDGKKIIPESTPYIEPKAAWETEEIENDAYGNWIKKTTFYHNIPQYIYISKITYFGEEKENSEPLVHPLQNTSEEEVVKKTHPPEELPIEQAQWLVEGTTTDNFPALRYYVLQYKEAPSMVTFTGPYIEAIALLNELQKDMGAEMVHSYSTNWGGQGECLIRYTLNFPHYGYVIQATNITYHDADDYEIPDFFSDVTDFDHESVYFSQIQLLRPSDVSEKRDSYFEEELEETIEKCMLQKIPDKPTINMIEATNNGFTIKERAVDDNFEIRDLDVNYGYGFSEFHKELMKRFNTSTKGLVLFHGMPGTGKTYYIRHLLRKMVASKKVVIYMPPNMVDHLVEPVFMTFLSRKIQDWASDGNFCVLLIEDAEPLLARRQEGVRIQGITNLLNMSDGILNDMLNLQIICTFNVDLKKLDNALLRPGRLIARKEFKPLSVIDANVLAQRLGIKHHFTSPVALGEIYAMQKNKNTLIHDVASDKNATTQIDDLI